MKFETNKILYTNYKTFTNNNNNNNNNNYYYYY